MLRKHSSLHPFSPGSVWQELRNHRRRFREEARFFNTSSSSFSRYRPNLKVSLKKVVSIILVKQSANWAPLCTHLNDTPSVRRSLMARAFSWVRNSEQLGVAVLVTRSYRLLQSVAAMLSGNCCAFKVAVAYVSGNVWRVELGRFQSTFGSNIQAQHKRIHDRWSRTAFKDTVSAAKVLVTTLWIFLQPQDSGDTGLDTFSRMDLCVPMIMLPVCELGLVFEAKDASENARNLKSSIGMDWIWMVVSWYFLASWSAWLADIRVLMVALFIDDCNMLSRLERSGLVCTAAYCKLPIKPRSDWRSSSVILESSCCRRSIGILIGSIARTYVDCFMVIVPFESWSISIPVKVNCLIFLLPKGYFFSSCVIFSTK